MPVITIGTKRILYIHVPKTGGTSVESLLRSYGGTMTAHARPRAAGLPCTAQHFHGEVLRQVFGNADPISGSEHDFDLVFMTVREPIARLLSEYRHQRTLRPQKNLKRDVRKQRSRMPGAAEVLGFRAWTAYALARTARNPYFADNHFRPQHEFGVWEAVVFKLEDGLGPIKACLDKLTGTHGTLPERPAMVATDRSGSAEDLGRLRRRVDAYYAGDYATFGY